MPAEQGALGRFFGVYRQGVNPCRLRWPGNAALESAGSRRVAFSTIQTLWEG